MPHVEGYTIYVAPHRDQRGGYLARAYRDSDDTHVWSSEHARTLEMALREVGQKVEEDLHALRRQT
jgi:hypothetical protein